MANTVDKPLRLYVMTIFIVTAYGLLPLVSAIPFAGKLILVGPRFLPFNGSFQVLYDVNGEIPFLVLGTTLGLSLLTAGAAIVTFLGVKEARWATLIFQTLDVLWWFFLVISAIMDRDRATGGLGLAFQLLFPPFWLAFVWWNWTRSDITEWLNFQSDLEN